jgi:hypothetical protein
MKWMIIPVFDAYVKNITSQTAALSEMLISQRRTELSQQNSASILQRMESDIQDLKKSLNDED